MRSTGARALFAHLCIPPTTAILVWFLWGRVGVAQLLAPIAALNLLAIRGVSIGSAYRRERDDPGRAAIWGRRFGFGIVAYGAAFGAAGFFLFVPGDLVSQIPVVLFVGGMAAGGLTTQVAFPREMHVFHALALGPTIARLLLDGTRSSLAIAGMLAVYAVVLSVIGRAGARAFRELTTLKLRESRLAGALARAGEQLAANNAMLDQRVREVTEKLAEANQLASLGRLAAGVAHEINNPLTAVLSNAEYLEERLDSAVLAAGTKEDLGGALSGIQMGGDRIRDIVRDLSALVNKRVGGMRPVDVHELLERCAKVSHDLLCGRAKLRTDFADDLPAVLGEPSRLSQLFLNLLMNAAESIAPGDGVANSVVLRTAVSGDRVVVQICDSGCGIAAGAIDRVFDAFYSTKPAGQGSGLGLSICRNIVDAHGGSIAVESSSSGTVMTVALRAARTPVAATA